MSEGAAPFLAAAEAAGDDPAPCLVFADWLEDRGDPRSHFIRAQCADWVNVDPQLAARWARTMGEAAWLRPVRERLGRLDRLVSRYSFHRGLPAGIQVHSSEWAVEARHFIDQWPRLQQLSLILVADGHPPRRRTAAAAAIDGPGRQGLAFRGEDAAAIARSPVLSHIRKLEIRGFGEDAAARILTSKSLTHLRSLEFPAHDPTGERLSQLASQPWFSRLEELHLSGHLGADAPRVFAETPFETLQSFAWTSQRRLVRGPETAFHSWPWVARLTALKLQDIPPRMLLEALDQSPSVPRLRTLELVAPSPMLHLDEWPRRRGCPHLRSLTLDRWSLTSNDLYCLARVPWLHTLQRLSVRDGVYSDAGLRELADSPFLKELEWLDVGHSGVGDAGVSALARLPAGRLRWLSLDAGAYTAAGLNTFLNSTAATGLKSLTVGGQGRYHGPETAGVMSRALEHLPLERLILSEFLQGGTCLQSLSHASTVPLRELACVSSSVEEAGIRALLESPLSRQILILDLSNNRLGDAGLEALANSPQAASLCELTLVRNGITAAGIRALTESPYLQNLVRLNLDENDLGLEGLQRLADWSGRTNLLRLSVRSFRTAEAAACDALEHCLGRKAIIRRP